MSRTMAQQAAELAAEMRDGYEVDRSDFLFTSLRRGDRCWVCGEQDFQQMDEGHPQGEIHWDDHTAEYRHEGCMDPRAWTLEQQTARLQQMNLEDQS